MMTKLDLNEDLLVTPFKGGVKLIRPEYSLRNNNMSLKRIFDFNINVFFLGNDSNTILKLNEQCMLTCALLQYSSTKDIVGRKMENLFKPDGISVIIKEGLTVCKEKQMKIFEEQVMCLNDMNFSVLAFKFPLYTDENKIPAILGFSILSDNTLFPQSSSLSTGIALLMQTGLLSLHNNEPLLPGRKINGKYLSNQELKCLDLLLKGMSARMSAKHLHLSQRTVETHLDHVKSKFNVKTKYELIEYLNRQ